MASREIIFGILCSGEWNSAQDAKSDLQLGVLSSYAVQLMMNMNACVPVSSSTQESSTSGQGSPSSKRAQLQSMNIHDSYQRYQIASASGGEALFWGADASNAARLTMRLLGTPDDVRSTGDLLDELLPSIEYDAPSAAATTTTKSKASGMSAALARRGSILGSQRAAQLHENPSDTPVGSSEQSKNTFGKFTITLPMFKMYLSHCVLSEARLQVLLDHCRACMRRINKTLKSTPNANAPHCTTARPWEQAIEHSLENFLSNTRSEAVNQEASMLACFLSSDGSKYIPAAWRARKANSVAKGAPTSAGRGRSYSPSQASKRSSGELAENSFIAKRLLAAFHTWRGGAEFSAEKTSAARSSSVSTASATTRYLDTADSDDEPAPTAGTSNSQGANSTKDLYALVGTILTRYKTYQSQLCKGVLDVAVRYYLPSPEQVGTARKPADINIACAAVVPDIQTTLVALGVADEDEEEDNAAAGKAEGSDASVPAPTSALVSNIIKPEVKADSENAQPAKKKSTGPTAEVSTPAAAPTGRSRGLTSAEDPLGLFSSTVSKGILKKPATLSLPPPEEDLTLPPAGPVDASGWAPVQGIGANAPPLATAALPAKPPATTTVSTAAIAGIYRCIHPQGAYIRSGPDLQSKTLGELNMGGLIDCTGKQLVMPDGDIFMETIFNGGNSTGSRGGSLSEQRGWVRYKIADTVVLQLVAANAAGQLPPPPSTSVSVPEDSSAYSGSAPRRRNLSRERRSDSAITVDSDATGVTTGTYDVQVEEKNYAARGSQKVAAAGSATNSPEGRANNSDKLKQQTSDSGKRKSVLHFFQKVVGMKKSKSPKRNERSEGESLKEGNTEFDSAKFYGSGGGHESTREDGSEIGADFADESAGVNDTREDEEADGDAASHVSAHSSPSIAAAEETRLQNEEAALLDELVGADDQNMQLELIARLRTVRAARAGTSASSAPVSARSSNGPTPVDGIAASAAAINGRYASPRTSYFRNVFSSIASQENGGASAGTERGRSTAASNRLRAPSPEASVSGILRRGTGGWTDTSRSYLDGSELDQGDAAQHSSHASMAGFAETPTIGQSPNYQSGQRGTDSGAGSIAELLQRGHSSGQYAQALRHILRDMQDPGLATPNGPASSKGSRMGSPSLAAMEEVLRLGQTIARHEQQKQQNTVQKTPRTAPGGGLPRPPTVPTSAGRSRSKSPAPLPEVPDPYAFSDKVRPAGARGGGVRRLNQHQAFKNSPEELSLRAKIRVLELKERRLDREEKQRIQGGISFNIGAGSSNSSRAVSPASTRAQDLSGLSDNYGRTPQRASGSGAGTPVAGSVSRLAMTTVPGVAPDHSIAKQPKRVFGHRV